MRTVGKESFEWIIFLSSLFKNRKKKEKKKKRTRKRKSQTPDKLKTRNEWMDGEKY